MTRIEFVLVMVWLSAVAAWATIVIVFGYREPWFGKAGAMIMLSGLFAAVVRFFWEARKP